MRLRITFPVLAVACLAQFGTVHAQEGFLRVEANPSKGFRWPYYLGIPPALKTPTVLLVEPNNSNYQSDDLNWHDQMARQWAYSRSISGELGELGSPFLMPSFPRPATPSGFFTQGLDRDTILTKLPGYERLDLQLVAMIEDAREKLAARGVRIEKKVWMWGFSASASFVNRFTLMHPEVVLAASMGSPGSYPTVPAAQWKGKRLRYPVGVADFQEIIGKPFNAQAFREVAQQIYIGDQDLEDLADNLGAFEPEDGALIHEVFGDAPGYLRWPRVEAVFDSAGANTQFVVIPGLGHRYPDWPFMRDFFLRNRVAPLPRQEKPLLHRIHLPHITCTGGMETVIVVTNTMEGPSMRGELQAYRADGGAPISVLALNLRAGERKEVAACRELPNPQAVAYASLSMDSGFLAAHARLVRPGGDGASIAGTRGNMQGVFARIERQGSVTIGFLNPGTTRMGVRVYAYDDSGREAGSTMLALEPGSKISGKPEEILEAGGRNATYLRYSSPGNRVVAFVLSESADGVAVDAVPELPRYNR